MTGFQAERLDDCYLADISVFDLICIIYILIYHFLPLKTIKCR